MTDNFDSRMRDLMASLDRTLATQARIVNDLVAEGEQWVAAAGDAIVARSRRRRVNDAVVAVHEAAFEIDAALALGPVCRPSTSWERREAERARAVDLGAMYEMGQITLAERNAAEHVGRLYARRQLYEGVKSALGTAGEATGGGRDYDLLTVRRLDAARALVDLERAIVADERTSPYAAERQTWPAVLELILGDGLTFAAAAKRLGVGKRDMVRKRFRRALTAAAHALGAGDLRPRMRTMRPDDAVPRVMSEDERNQDGEQAA